MGYNVFITRSTTARQKPDRPITIPELRAIASAHGRLRVHEPLLLWQPRGGVAEHDFLLDGGRLRHDTPNRVVLDVMRDLALVLRANVVGESNEMLAQYTDVLSAENALVAKGDHWAWDIW